jgi:hypothetical protein
VRSCSTSAPHGDALWDRFGPGEGASVRWYCRSLYDAFAARRDDLDAAAAPMLDDLGRTVEEIDRLAACEADAPVRSRPCRATR